MTEEVKQLRKVLDEPIDFYLSLPIPEAQKESIRQAYDTMFKKMMEQAKLLTIYRHDYSVLKQTHESVKELLM